MAVLRLHELFYPFHIPAPLLPGQGRFVKAFKSGDKNARSDGRGDKGNPGYMTFLFMNEVILPGQGYAAINTRQNYPGGQQAASLLLSILLIPSINCCL